MVQLPRAGRTGATPRWPLTREPTEEQKRVWRDLWRTPQAVAWERLGWTRVVARYVACLVAAEKPGASGALLAEVRQLEDRLGLSPMAMLRLRWEIVDEEAAGEETSAEVTSLERYRRLTAGR